MTLLMNSTYGASVTEANKDELKFPSISSDRSRDNHISYCLRKCNKNNEDNLNVSQDMSSPIATCKGKRQTTTTFP